MLIMSHGASSTFVLWPLLLVVSVSPPVGVAVVVVPVLPAINPQSQPKLQCFLPSPGVVVHAVYERHPVPGLVEEAGVRVVGPVAAVGHLEAVGLAGCHVAAVRRPRLAVETEVTTRGREE